MKKIDVGSLLKNFDSMALYAYFYHNPVEPYENEKLIASLVKERNKLYMKHSDVIEAFLEIFETSDGGRLKLDDVLKAICKIYPALKISPSVKKELSAYMRKNNIGETMSNGSSRWHLKPKTDDFSMSIG